MQTADPVEALVERLRQAVGTVKFPRGRTKDTGDIYERYGFGDARQFAKGKQDHALVRVLDEVHKEVQASHLRLETAVYIIRNLEAILTFREDKV